MASLLRGANIGVVDMLENNNVCLVVENGALSVQERATPMPGPSQVLVQIEVVRVHPMDTLLTAGGIRSPVHSLIPGSEFCGIVVGLGKQVDPDMVKVGDKVAVEPRHYCGNCHYCLKGQTNLCEVVSHLYGWNMDGGLQQFIAVDKNLVHTFNVSVPWIHAALTSQTAIVTTGLTKAGVLPGDSVVVLGTHISGLLGVMFARGLGAEFVCLIGLREAWSEEMALSCGASMFLEWNDNHAQEDLIHSISSCIKQNTENRGVDAFLFASDHGTGAPDMKLALSLLRPGGSIVAVQQWGKKEVDTYMEGRSGRLARTGDDVMWNLMDQDVRFINIKGFTSSMFQQSLRWIEGGVLEPFPHAKEGLRPLSAWDEVVAHFRSGSQAICMVSPQAGARDADNSKRRRL